MTADEVKATLGLVQHPCEGGWYVRTYEADVRVDVPRGQRRVGTAIYYLLEPDTFSEMHALESDEVFHHYLGGAVEMLQLWPDGRTERVVIGKDLLAGERPQVVVPRGVWQGSRLLKPEGFALLGCTVSPGFEFVDYATKPRAELAAKWPGEAGRIAALTRE
jgi:predicted cupin superfamily sugar epimerase